VSADPFLPESKDLDSLREASRTCRGCPLFERATQTVFGAGDPRARTMIVGEQPGDKEDIEGRPFVGPAGLLLRHALDTIGIDVDRVYITNTVKHFKWEPRGKARIHKKPSAREVEACAPWLMAEIAAVRPEMVVCLGATAASALLGKDFRVTRQRGRILPGPGGTPTLATVHPSSILRIREPEERSLAVTEFQEDLATALVR